VIPYPKILTALWKEACNIRETVPEGKDKETKTFQTRSPKPLAPGVVKSSYNGKERQANGILRRLTA
jgi:hypothetical protein